MEKDLNTLTGSSSTASRSQSFTKCDRNKPGMPLGGENQAELERRLRKLASIAFHDTDIEREPRWTRGCPEVHFFHHPFPPSTQPGSKRREAAQTRERFERSETSEKHRSKAEDIR